MQKICKKCNNSFESKYKNSFCEDCKSKFTKHQLQYYSNVQTKNCIRCNSKFEALPKQTLCKKCRDDYWKNSMVHTYETVQQPVLCNNPNCETIVSYRPVKYSFKTKAYFRGHKLCESCKSVSKQWVIDRMRHYNPMSKGCTYITKFAKSIRGKLRIWRKQILLRDNGCTLCGSTTKLEVHHTYPLRDIINDVLKSKNQTIPNKDDTHFYDLVKDVVDFHTLDMGITVCNECHCRIDKYANIINRVKNENKKDRTNN